MNSQNADLQSTYSPTNNYQYEETKEKTQDILINNFEETNNIHENHEINDTILNQQELDTHIDSDRMDVEEIPNESNPFGQANPINSINRANSINLESDNLVPENNLNQNINQQENPGDDLNNYFYHHSLAYLTQNVNSLRQMLQNMSDSPHLSQQVNQNLQQLNILNETLTDALNQLQNSGGVPLMSLQTQLLDIRRVLEANTQILESILHAPEVPIPRIRILFNDIQRIAKYIFDNYIKHPSFILFLCFIFSVFITIHLLYILPSIENHEIGYFFDWMSTNRNANLLLASLTLMFVFMQWIGYKLYWYFTIGGFYQETEEGLKKSLIDNNPFLVIAFYSSLDFKMLRNHFDFAVWIWIFFYFRISSSYLYAIQKIKKKTKELIIASVNQESNYLHLKILRKLINYCTTTALSTFIFCYVGIWASWYADGPILVLLFFPGLMNIIKALKCISSLQRCTRLIIHQSNQDIKQLDLGTFMKKNFWEILTNVSKIFHFALLIIWYTPTILSGNVMGFIAVREMHIALEKIYQKFTKFRKFKLLEKKFPRVPEDALKPDEKCSICHENLTIAHKLSCSHIFHMKCLFSWLKNNRTCPICRAIVVENQVQQAQNSGRFTTYLRRIFTIFRPQYIQILIRDQFTLNPVFW